MNLENTQSQVDKVRALVQAEGLTNYGVVRLTQPLSLDRYKKWLANGHHGEMAYLQRHLPIKENPQLHYPKMRSAITFRENYYPAPKEKRTSRLRVALYALSEDYHQRLFRKYEGLVNSLKANFPQDEFLFQTDSGPLLERDLAYRSGLGWFGKNSCLIDQNAGSLFFIAEILTSLDVEWVQTLHPDRCGKCTRCIDACPTSAILEDRQIDARKCISYLTIEQKGLPSAQLRPLIKDWFFGCDICQTVCPWNEKAFGSDAMRTLSKEVNVLDEEMVTELAWLLQASDKELKKAFEHSPLLRAKPFGLRRNALVIVANLNARSLRPLVQPYLQDPRLSELATWVLEQFPD